MRVSTWLAGVAGGAFALLASVMTALASQPHAVPGAFVGAGLAGGVWVLLTVGLHVGRAPEDRPLALRVWRAVFGGMAITYATLALLELVRR